MKYQDRREKEKKRRKFALECLVVNLDVGKSMAEMREAAVRDNRIENMRDVE